MTGVVVVVVILEVEVTEGVGVEVVVEGTGCSTVLKLAGRGMISSKSLGFTQTDCFVTLL